jgi:membrane protease YdiL (CAAX protease family)
MIDRPSRFPWLYLVLGFGLSWAIWIPIANTGRDYQESALLLVGVLVGAFGPGLGAIILTYFNKEEGAFQEFSNRIYDFRRIRPSWILIILALWPALHAAAIGITRALNGPIPESPFLEELIAKPNTIPLITFMYFLQSGVEEVGWRGYLQEKLGQIFSLPVSTLLTGLIHTIWYLPLFWVVGTNQIQMGFGQDFLVFIIFVVSSSVLTAWCYYGNRRSIMAAALLHTAGNLSFDIFAYAPGTTKHLVFVIFSFLAAVLVLIYFHTHSRKHLAYESNNLPAGPYIK